jgi:hypothetical protein
MAVTNWTLIMGNRKTGTFLLHNLESKWTYKTALGIAKEAIIDETHDLICIVETSKILLKDEKKSDNKEELPIG